jgi:hypothetical protein
VNKKKSFIYSLALNMIRTISRVFKEECGAGRVPLPLQRVQSCERVIDFAVKTSKEFVRAAAQYCAHTRCQKGIKRGKHVTVPTRCCTHVRSAAAEAATLFLLLSTFPSLAHMISAKGGIRNGKNSQIDLLLGQPWRC